MRLKEWIIDSASGPFGSNLKVENFVSTGFPIIDGANLKGIKLTDNITKFVTEAKARSLERSIAKQHDVVVTISGTLGQISYIPYNSKYQEYLCSQRQFRVTFDETKVSVKYLVYYFHTQCGQKKILAFANYVGVPALSQPIPNFKNIEVDFPDLNTQIKVVEVLSALDDKIELNNKVNQELEKTAKDLYNYWFVQFDFPDGNKRPYKSSGGKMVYNDVLKREIPEGWEVKNLLDIVEWISGAQPPKATFIYQPQNGYVRFIQNRDYAGDTNVTYIKESKNNKVCDVFDIMMDKYGDAGRVRYGLAGAYNVALSKIKVNVRYGQEYIRKFLESDSVYNYLYNACMASTRASLNGEILGNLNIAIPNDTLLKNFEMRNKQIINQILQNKQENEILSNLRDFLLPMLMNGQVSVSD